jgi:DnaJ-class molecular chaperone
MTMAFLAQTSHYEILGIPHGASSAEVEAAFRQRMAELPDAGWRRLLLLARSGRSARRIAAARDTLVQAASRAAYDASLRSVHFWMPLQ